MTAQQEGGGTPAGMVAKSPYNLCDGTGWVCENHPTLAWGGMSAGTFTCDCGAGMPCAGCKSCGDLTPTTPRTPAGEGSGVGGEVTAYLIWASQGEYSDRREWPISVMFDKGAAEAATIRLGELWRALAAIYRRDEIALDEAGDWNGNTLFETTEEGREYAALTGDTEGDFGCYGEDRSFTCAIVPVWSAARAALARSDASEGGGKC